MLEKKDWREFDVYLFDIDGTLLQCTDAVHYFAFCKALGSIVGRPVSLDGVVAHGNTDMGIVRDALNLAGVRENEWRNKTSEIQDAMCSYVQARQEEMCVTALSGAREVLQQLRARGATLGVATGNLEAIGRLKLQRARLLPFFDFGCWSDACESRSEVFREARAMALSWRTGCRSICVIGDTPADIAAARENGLQVIAVASGIYSAQELESAGPDLCIRSLTELLQPAQSLPA